VKLLVIACNSVAAVAARTIADLSPVPVLDVIDAGARAAVAATRTRRVGVIGTLATVNSAAYDRAIHAHDAAIQIRSQACPLFVPLVEEGWLDHPVTRLTVQEYLAPLIAQDVDTLVLGCTHYPLLKGVLRDVAGDGVRLVDSADAMAQQVEQLLREQALASTGDTPGEHEYFVTDVPQRFQKIGELFLGRPLSPVHVVKW
jgi:glutamate racemase